MLDFERAIPSGAWKVCALVWGDGMNWYETRTFYGYTKREAGQLFRQWVSDNGYKIMRGY